jgi:hypothetical protein
MDALTILQRLGSGKLMEELATALSVTAEEVVTTGKPGTVTLTLKVSNKQQGDAMVFVDEQISRTAPKKDPRGALFYAVQGDLYREDPRQGKLDFRTVDTNTGEIKDLDYPDRIERTVE